MPRILFEDDFSTDKSAEYQVIDTGVPPSILTGQFVATDLAVRVWDNPNILNGYVQIDVVVDPIAGFGAWLLVWRDQGTGGADAYQITGNDAGCEISKTVGGVDTSLGSFAAVGANGRVRVDFFGSGFFFYVNGSRVAEVVDATFPNAGYCDFLAQNCTLDNFQVGTLGFLGPFPPAGDHSATPRRMRNPAVPLVDVREWF